MNYAMMLKTSIAHQYLKVYRDNEYCILENVSKIFKQ
jgi:hypothetical protein